VSARRIAILTGSRAEYGLLRTVIRACEACAELETHVIVTGTHLLGPALTVREVERECARTLRVPMQRDDEIGRLHDARALGRGIQGVADAIESVEPDFMLVLGDRIEALAGACAASVGGVITAHMHGGDRAEGVADEAMRHAITKLAHLHFPATKQSADRIEKMGEDAWRIHTVGSPAIDGLDGVAPLDDAAMRDLTGGVACDIDAVFMLHPIGDGDDMEQNRAESMLAALSGLRVLCLSPNHDPGRNGIVRAISRACEQNESFTHCEHLDRPVFIGLLKRLAETRGVLVGNSSAGLIECAGLGLGVVDIGDRQSGRERAGNVVHAPDNSTDVLRDAIRNARDLSGTAIEHPYGNGRTGQRVAEMLVALDLSDPRWLGKRSTY